MLCADERIVYLLLWDWGYMKKNLVIALAFLGLGSVANTVFAEPEVSYTYAQLNYVSENLDDYDCTQDGLSLSGSVALTEEVFAVGSFSDVSGGGCGSSTFSAGAGYRIAYTEDLSLYTTLSFANTSVDEGDGDSGLVVSAGGRSFVMQNLEARAALSYSSLGDGSVFLNGGVNYWFDTQFAVTGDINWGADSSGFSVGLRANF